MGDEGIAALASVVSQGRLVHLKSLNISRNGAVTQQDIIALAQAMDVRGLPKLRTLVMIELVNLTAAGISAIAHAVIKGCPHVEEIEVDSDHEDTLDDILEAVGTGSGRQCPLVRDR